MSRVVRVDRETGDVEVERYLVAYDVGRAVNPMLVEGQIAGGLAQGLGGALFEEFVYDERGEPLSVTFADYLMPTAREVPPVDVLITEDAPSPLNPLGLKGAGEGGINAVGAAIASAIDDALGMPGAVTQLAGHAAAAEGNPRERIDVARLITTTHQHRHLHSQCISLSRISPIPAPGALVIRATVLSSASSAAAHGPLLLLGQRHQRLGGDLRRHLDRRLGDRAALFGQRDGAAPLSWGSSWLVTKPRSFKRSTTPLMVAASR